jgi:acyl-homoserine lactone acylase PvdQ
MLKAKPRDARAGAAVRLLENWDRQVASERPEPVISSPDRSVFLTALGQSAHILSPHYADLLPRWRRTQWLRLPHTAEGQTLRLVPKSSNVLRTGRRC